ncbi:inverse autotransporter beta domain-containing protein [Salmonella enterica subsp. enterica serovar Poona]|nr:inverse autotransporter beta domain-containing protein [Salmonella enterica subsp. enterica serovar Poona]EKS5832376.1 inverse autotransporter beta domain-containing protein [Salmonella enterica]EKS5905653.1 inverse autotransporter beta domain-containing protein [Salmonella enterica]
MVKTNPSSSQVRRVAVYGLAGLQFFFQVTPAFAGVFQADEQSVAQTAMEAGRVLQGSNSGDAARQLLTSLASGQAADAVTQWLNQFGTAKTQLSVDSDFSLKGSSLDVLLPFYNTPKNVLFTQLGMRDNDGRFTTNAGLGHRYFTDNGWMLGYNVFYDVDWRNTNRRYGIGVEAWRDHLKLSANGYKRLSDWRQSPTVIDYDERPADGWDIRAEGWLPAYPQLGGKLVYEQYYGNEVALFGESERQKNPHAITAGVTWTPFPLLTAGVDYRRGKNGADDTRLNLGLTYRIGEPLAHQLDSSRVGAQRSLAANRLELVNRNNDVVLEYRKQTLITLQLPPDVYGAELTTVTLTPQVNAKYGLSRIGLDDAELRQAGGKIISNTGNRITLQLPAWSAENQSVTLSGRARDTRGNLSDIARTRILVSPAVQQQLAVSTDKTTATADGADSVHYTLTVTGSDEKPVSGQAVRWEHNGGTLNGENTTNADGVATATLTSQTAGIIRVAATTHNQTAKAADVTFVAAMQGELLADRTQALADGQEAVSYTLTLKTTDGKPLSGKNVTFTTTAGQLNRTQGTTDQNGQLTVQLTSTRAGQAVVNAFVDGTTISAAPVTFETRPDTAIVVNKTSAVADGQDSIILTAVIRDAAGVPVAGQAVTWHTDNGQFTQQLYLTLQAGRTTAVADGNDAITYTLNVRDAAGQPVKDRAVQWSTDLGTLSTLQGTTSAQGEATVTLTSTQAGQAVVNATVDGKQISAQSVSFTRTVRGAITVEKERVYPGSRQTVTLTLTDAAGNPVSGERVDWHADSGNLWQTQGTTDAQGRATTTWESTMPGTATITADAYGQQYTAPVITVMPALTVSSVTGIDATGADGKNFGKRIPNNTWPGAKFRIDTENAAGTVTWTASSPAVSINGNVMTVKSNPAGVTLTGTDTDGQTVTLSMGSNWFAQSATESGYLNIDVPGSAIHTCKALNAGVATEGQLNGIISEWGELQKYPGWTSLASDWLYSSTTVVQNGRTYYRAFYLPQSTVGVLSGPDGYYACR